MFAASRTFAFFDYMRIPYIIDASLGTGLPEGLGRISVASPTSGGPGRSLYWWTPATPRRRADRQRGRFLLGEISLFGHVATLPPPADLEQAGGWRSTQAVLDVHGRAVADVWTHDCGSIYLPFDPGEVMRELWSEGYLSVGRRQLTVRVRRTAVKTYYLLRPMLPRRLQLTMRRTYAKRQKVPDFPDWPLESSLHDLYAWLLDLTTSFAGVPVPWISPWPDGKSWALVLTHDVETDVGRDSRSQLRDPERARGYRSSWNFVPKRYEVSQRLVDEVRADSCEVGLHGLRHDGRDLASRRMLRRRLPAMRAAADAWGAVGFRAPATQRGWDLIPMLGVDYDSSYTDTDPYEPQPGGCCTWLPFFNRDTVELPITLPQDNTLFSILGCEDGQIWLTKAREIRRRGGMVLVLTHPDNSSDPRLASAWEALLDEFVGDEPMWNALGKELASWWRDRAASEVRPSADGWRIVGPGQRRGRIELSSQRPVVRGDGANERVGS